MTTGVTIYLVSACTTGEEFVAAFRRYADRVSLFIPIADPIPSGRRGRFAVTLTGGGVMIEGDGEVISSAKTASVLHGRIGMTIRFAELDDASKTVIADLEKARLVAKPPAPAVVPRSAELPATPRAKPPAPNARVDAAATLAECVAIGDLGALAAIDKTPPKAGPKFVMPDVLPVGTPRPKTPSAPPEMRPKTPSTPPVPRPKTPSIPPAMPSLAPLPGSGGIPKPATTGDSAKVAAFFEGDPAVKGDSSKVAVPKPPPKSPAMKALSSTTLHGPGVPPKPVTPSSGTPVVPSMSVTPSDGTPLPGSGAPAQIMAAVQVNTTPTQMTAATPTSAGTPRPTPPDTAAAGSATVRTMSAAMPMPTPTGMAVAMPTPTGMAVATPTPTGMAAVGAPTIPTMSAVMPTPTPQSITAVTGTATPTEMTAVPSAMLPVSTVPMPTVAPSKPTPKNPTAPSVRADATPLPGTTSAVKPPVVAEAVHELLVSELDEPTDLTAPPRAPSESGRTTDVGIAVTPGNVAVLPAVTPAANATPIETDDEIDTGVHAQPIPKAPSKPAPVIEEATPSGDWTIKPGETGLTIEPRKPDAPPPRQTGDWTIQLDSDSPDGWTEPAKVVKTPEQAAAPTSAPAPAPAPVPKRRPNQQENPPELAPVARLIEVVETKNDDDDDFDSEEPSIQVDPTLLEGVIVDPAKVDAMVAAARATGGEPVRATPLPLAPGLAAAAVPRATPLPPSLMPDGVPAGAALAPPLADGSPDPRRSTPLPMGPPTPVPGSLVDPRATPLPAGVMPGGAVDARIATPVPGALTATAVDSRVATPLPIRPSQVAAMQVQDLPGRLVTDGGTGFFKDTGEVSSLSGSYLSHDPARVAKRRRRLLVVAIIASLLVVAGVVLVLVLMMGGDDKKRQEVTAPTAIDAQREAVADAAAVVVAPDAAEAPATVDAAVAPKADCFVEVVTAPPGAEIVRDTNVLGTTPSKVSLPCGEEVKLTVRKLKFVPQVRAVTATAEGAPLRLALQKVMFSIKVSSQPAGANISLNGKSIAMTPTTLKVPGFELSTITFSKDGYVAESYKVTPKQNNQTVHAQLKKKKR